MAHQFGLLGNFFEFPQPLPQLLVDLGFLHRRAGLAIERVIVIPHATHRRQRALLAFLALRDLPLAVLDLRLAGRDRRVLLLRPARPRCLVVGLLRLVAALLGVLFGSLQFFLGSFLLAFEWSHEGLAQVALAVKQLRQVMAFHTVVGTSDQPFGPVAGQQEHRDRQTVNAFLDGNRPGGLIPTVGILLDEDKVRGRFGSYQANVVPVEILVRDQSDVPVFHALGQAGTFLVGVGDEIVLNGLAEVVESTEGGGDEMVQLGMCQEGRKSAQTAGTTEDEVDEQRQDEPTQETQPGGGAEEGDDFGLEAGVIETIIAEPGTEGGARDAVLAGVVTLREVLGSGKMVKGLGHGLLGPARSICVRGGLIRRVSESHGSIPVVVPGKATVGNRAWLVQRAPPTNRAIVNKRVN